VSVQGELFDATPGRAAAQADQAAPVRAVHAPPVDHQARRTATTCFDRPILLEAGAGTGKTATLVARIVHWCLGPGWEAHAGGAASPEAGAPLVLRRLAAITFTEAAAAEMAGRVSAALARVHAAAAASEGGAALRAEDLPPGFVPDALPADPAVVGARAEALRGALDQLDVGTIHAFCRRLIATWPLEVGLAPGFEVDATFAGAERAVRTVLERFLREAWGGRDDARPVALARRRVDPTMLERAVLDLVRGGARAADLEADPLAPEALAPRLAGLAAALAAFRGAVPPGLAQARRSPKSLEVLAALDATESALAAEAGVADLCATLREVWDATVFGRLAAWAAGELNKTEAAAVDPEACGPLAAAAADLCAALGPLRELDPELLALARPLLRELLVGVEQELRRQGIATFPDLLAEARRLLEEHPAVARAERRRLGQLLVDEFQDTDGVQCAVVRQLALVGDPDERPGLFLVGDPKQSIFAWRSADLEAYDAFGEEVEAAGGARLSLSCNFRSHAAVLAEVERAVAPVMEARRDVQPPFARLEPGRADAHAPVTSPTVEYWVSWPALSTGEGGARVSAGLGAHVEDSYRAEALAVARDIRAARDARPRPWKSFAVLFRTLAGAQSYLDRLRELDVPYQVQSDRNYYQRREVVDATALVRAVLDPTDQLALVALLRSPMVGTPDAALIPLWSEDLPGRMARLAGPDAPALAALDDAVGRAAARVPAGIPGLDGIAGWEHSLRFALSAVAELRAAYRELPADAWIELLRGRFLPDAVEAARFLGAWRLANLERFFRELGAAMEERAGDDHAVLRTLRANLERDDRGESARLPDSGVDAVQILTVHGAKGLEFSTVYVAQTHRPGRPRTSSMPTEFSRHLQGASYRLFGAPEPGWYDDTQRRARAEAAERVRLLYVALTRAKDRLVVLGGFAASGAAPGWERAKNFCDLLQSRVGAADALAHVAEAVGAGGPVAYTDEHGVLWRVPATEPEAPRAAAARPVSAEPPLAAPAAIARSAGELARARAAARGRMARPFHGAASAAGHGEPQRDFEERGSTGRAAALAVGTELHRVFELADLGAAPDAELERLRPAVTERLRAALADTELAPALQRAEELLGGAGTRALLARLCALGDGVLARELPVLLRADGDDAPSDGLPGGAVGYVAGTIDLLYRDPRTGELVVADYKTDPVASEAELVERGERYREQGANYARAVREALGLEASPRFELWFLQAGEVRVLEV